MPTWKKVVISGSGVAQLSNDANYLIDAQSGAVLSGSFSGSFVGDGSGLTNIVASGTISASAQVVVQETDGFSGLQSNISGSIDTLSGSAHTQRVAIESGLSSDISDLSGSAHTQRLAIESSLDTDISDLSGSAHTQRVALSASGATYTDSKISDLSGSAHTARVSLSGSTKTYIDNKVAGIVDSAPATLDTLNELAAALNDDPNFSASIATTIGTKLAISTFDTYSGSAATALRAEYVAADSALSGSAHTQRTAIESSLSGDISSLSGSAHDQRVSISASLAASIAGLGGDYATDAELTAVSSSAHTQRLAIGSSLGTDISDLSGSAHTQRVSLSGSLKDYTDQKIAGLIDSAPATLDTLNEIAAAIGDNATVSQSFASTLATKASSAQLDSVSSSFATTQATQDGRLDSLESFTASLDDTYTTDAELNAATASVKTYADNAVDTLSGSAHTQRLAIESSLGTDISDLSGSAHTQREAVVNSLSASSATALRGEYVAADTTLSASFAASIAGLSSDYNDLTNIPVGIISASVEGDAQGQIKLNGVNVDINDLGTGDSPTFQNLTVNGNLTTLGTVTNVNTTDLNIEDKFILLNSGSASGNSGLIVQNSATIGEGTALFYDDTENRWALDHVGADAIGDTAAADSYVAAVTTDDTDTNLQKNGNIYVDAVSGEAFIYVA